MARNNTTFKVIRFFEVEKMYLNGVKSPVFSLDQKTCIKFGVHSKYLDEARSKYPCDEPIAARVFALPSSSLAAALINIAAGCASVGLSSAGESVAELVCSDGSIQYAVYDPSCGKFKACIVPKGEEKPIPYKLLDGRFYGVVKDKHDKHCATVLVLALLPFLMEDEEFKNGYDEIMHRLYEASAHEHDMSETVMLEISKLLTVISDNAELRLRYDKLGASIPFSLAEGELPLLDVADIRPEGLYFPVVSFQ